MADDKPAPPPRIGPSAAWWLRGPELQPILDDPAKVAAALLGALPPGARATIIAYAEFGLTGSITVNFNAGRVSTCEERSTHRVGAA